MLVSWAELAERTIKRRATASGRSEPARSGRELVDPGDNYFVSRNILAARDGIALADPTDDRTIAVVDADTGDPLGSVTWQATSRGPVTAWLVDVGRLPATAVRMVAEYL